MRKRYSETQNIESLSEQVTFRIGKDEFFKWDAIARTSYISTSELVRNVMRDNCHRYVGDEKMSSKLHISNQIDAFFVKKQVISNRNDANLMKIREILSDFEQLLDSTAKNTDCSEIEYFFYEVNKLLKLISEEDTFLFNSIEPQAKRIFRNKTLKRFVTSLSTL